MCLKIVEGLDRAIEKLEKLGVANSTLNYAIERFRSVSHPDPTLAVSPWCAAVLQHRLSALPQVADDKHFEIDAKRVAEDGAMTASVSCAPMHLDALAVMLRYRELLKVDDIFGPPNRSPRPPCRKSKPSKTDKHFLLRTGDVGRAFQAVGIALSPNIRGAAAPVR